MLMERGSAQKRRGAVSTACLRCHRRKQRCVGHPICGNCDAANVPCSRHSSADARRLAGLSKEELLKRIESLEERTSDAAVAPAHAEAEQPTETRSGRPPPPYYHDRHGHGLVDGHGSRGSNIAESDLGQSAEVASDIRQQDEERGTASWPRVYENGEDLPPEPESEHDHESLGPAPSIAVGTAASRRPILAAYLDNMHRRVPFCSYVDILSTNEDEARILATTQTAQMNFIRLYMACAIGARVKQLTGTVPPAEQAHDFLNRAVALHSIFTEDKEDASLVDKAEISLWLVLYKLRTSYTNEAWDLIGSAMRAAVAADLHRERHYRDHMGLPPSEAERHRLLFWAIYTIERNVCWAMKRPFSLADNDIDARLPTPLSHPACLQGPESISHASDSPSRPVDLRIFIATIELARINSQVYVQASRAGHGYVASDVLPLLERMREFEASLPQCSAPDYEFLLLHVNNAVRTLIEPLLSTLNLSDRLTQCCLDAAGAVCRLFKRLRLNRSMGFSFTMVKSVFLAGMTICFIISKSPSFWTPLRANDLRACSSSLFAAAERNAGARDYCETLDAIIEGVSEYVEQVTNAVTATNSSTSTPNTNTSSLGVIHGSQQTFERASTFSLASSASRTPQDAFDRLRHEFLNAKSKFASSAYPSFSLEPHDLDDSTSSAWTPAASVRKADGATALGFGAAFQSSPFDLFSEGFDMGTLGFLGPDTRFI